MSRSSPHVPLEQVHPAPFRGQARRAGFDRISHGVFHRTVAGLSADQQFRRELLAWLLVLPEGARFTHLTGATLRGWTLPKIPEGVPVFAAVSSASSRPRRPGLICSRLVTTPSGTTIDGLPVDDSEEILLRAARDLGVLDLQILVEGAMRAGDLDDDRMQAVLASCRPGVRQLRAAYRASRRRTESGGETVLGAFHRVMEIEVEPQNEIATPAGEFVARADFWVVGTKDLHEYDGAVHRDGTQHRKDLRRERAIVGAGYVRRGYTLDDLLNRSLVTMHEMDRALGRPHAMRRHRRWTTVLEQSLYSETGRQRLLNRWHRQMGVVEWSETA